MAKYAAVRLRISFSIFATRGSRRSCTNSARSAVVAAAFVEVGSFHPVPQTALGDPEIRRDLSDRPLTQPASHHRCVDVPGRTPGHHRAVLLATTGQNSMSLDSAIGWR